MPKRHGNLFDQCFSMEALYAAYERGRRGKRKTFSVMRFERDLGANLQALHMELHAGTYKPQPYRHFMVMEPKPRQISAPAFRDVVVQHAIYGLLNPIFDRVFIHDSYGCRVAKGTHMASDRAQQYLREAKADSFTLQLDIRRFYYNIDRDILRKLIERKIKDKRLVDLMMQFADDGKGPLGVPIGNLLSQLYALIYLDPLDHFVKREMKIKKYVRYVDDFILWCDTSEQAIERRDTIIAFLTANLALTLSRWTIAPVSRGVKFRGVQDVAQAPVRAQAQPISIQPQPESGRCTQPEQHSRQRIAHVESCSHVPPYPRRTARAYLSNPFCEEPTCQSINTSESPRLGLTAPRCTSAIPKPMRPSNWPN